MDVGVVNGSDTAESVASIDVAKGPHYLTVEGALEVLHEVGFNINLVTLRAWIRDKRLPFFRQGHRIYIERQEMLMHLRRRQTEATKAIREHDDGKQKKLARSRR